MIAILGIFFDRAHADFFILAAVLISSGSIIFVGLL